jgi:hypothetical protein
MEEQIEEGVPQLVEGGYVVYTDPRGAVHPALVTAIHGDRTGKPAINVAWCDPDLERDGWGWPIERASSVVHRDNQSAHGNYWDFN